MMRWWWFGPSVTKPELERELRSMRDAGIGGVEIQPVYPLELDDPETGFHNFPYLSDEFIDDLRFAAEKARELGLRFDLTLGSGWPFGGPHIPITQAAGKLRVISVSIPPGTSSTAVPATTTGETLLAAFTSTGKSSWKSLSLAEVHNGRLAVQVSPKPRMVEWFISSRSAMMVKRAAVGAEGFVLDHLDQSAIENHLRNVAVRLFSAFDDKPPYAVFSDSLEVYGSDWTGDLLQEFQKRRGYDLTPNLPALVQDIGPTTSDIRHDWGETLTELANERYLTPLRRWAADHGTKFRSQTYGIPAVTLSSNRLVDLPEGEGDSWRSFSPTRWASSASHLYGQNITSAESWTWLHSPAFRATPLDMKADADRFLLEGVNQIIGHGWPYSPRGVPEPGWSFYAAGAFNDHNPWWPVMPELTRYLQRSSYLLRQGKPVIDVALLLPTDDAWAGFTAGNPVSETSTSSPSVSDSMERLLGPDVIPQILEAGFNFDFIDAEAIDRIGIRYRALILPGCIRIPLATYLKIEEFARNGGIVIASGTLPSKAPGMLQSEKDSPRVRQISQALFRNGDGRGYFVQDAKRLRAMLVAHLRPDLVFESQTGELGFVHRSLANSEIYFVANTSNRQLTGSAKFRVKKRNLQFWDLFSGEISAAGSNTNVRLTLEPYESRVLVFSDDPMPLQETIAPTAEDRDANPLATDLQGNWSVTFPGLPRSTHVGQLGSWADNEATRFYSGAVIYETEFNFSPPQGKRVYLDFGRGTPTGEIDMHGRFFAGLESPVREAAQVFINDKLAGAIWKPPYRIEVTKQLRAGSNHLRIVVYNIAMNELAGRAPTDYSFLNNRYGQRFSPQDVEHIKPLPSGLLRAPQLIIAAGSS